MTAESSTHTYESGVQETVTLRRGPATPHDCALLKITYSDGEIADCYVNTAWLRDRADQLTDTPRPLTHDDMTFEDNHAGRDLARERLDGWKTEWERRIKAEKERGCWWRKWCEAEERAVRAEWLRAKAEQERDKARAGARLAFDRYREVEAERQKVVDELYRIRADEQPRPLTADDIEQLVTQNRCRVADAIRALYPEEPMATDVLAHAVMTALTEPTRPEGAEKVEAVLHQYWSGDINGDDLADRIVEEMNR